MGTRIHPTAIVHPGATLGADVEVGPYCIVEDRVEIGDRSRLDSFAQVKSFTRMGADNRIHSYACVGGEPQDLKFHGEESWLEIGDKNSIREYVTLHRGTESGGGVTSIGSGNLLMAYVHVAHDCRLGNGVIMSNASSLAGHVEIGDYAIISGMTGIHQFVRIGEHAFIGAMTGVGQDVPPYLLAAGVGSRAMLHGPNLIGLQRHAVGIEIRSALKKAYRLIWRTGVARQEALAEAESAFADVPEVMRMIEFIKASPRGVLQADIKDVKNGDEDSRPVV